MSKITQQKKKLKQINQSPKEQPWQISEAQLIMDILTGDANWEMISKKDLNIEFVKEYQDYLRWDIISLKKDLPKVYFNLFLHKLSWGHICNSQKLTPAFIRKYKDYLHWNIVAINGEITSEIFDEFFEDLYLSLNLHAVFQNKKSKISCDIIEKYVDYYDNNCWKYISGYQLTEKFIEKHSHQLNWDILSRYQIFSQDFILRNKKLIKWNKLNINSFRYWSREFIKNEVISYITNSSTILILLEFSHIGEYMLDNVTEPSVWKNISYSASLSEDFIKRNINKLSKKGLLENRNINYTIKNKIM